VARLKGEVMLIAVVALGAQAFEWITPAFGGDVVMVDSAAAGKRFDGIGAVSGGGATSVLLKDYPEPQRGQILDLLFKPKFGAAMSALLVEIPGDGNSTQGSELSHMHSRDDENYRRGYEWWVMSEAKKRNPAITLDGLAWSVPGWVGNGDLSSEDMCEYYVKWIHGLKNVYGLEFDAIGCRNERGVYTDFVKRLRSTLNSHGLEKVKVHAFDNWGKAKWDWCNQLDTDADLRAAVDIISNHTMSEVPTPTAVKELADRLRKPIWNTEEHVYKKGFDCEISLVQVFNENFISNDVTKVICWYLVSSFYPIEPYYDVTVMTASSPWSGNYTVNPALWAYAHYGQFCEVGWRYVNGACNFLGEGGSYVTLTSGRDYSIIAETKGAKVPQQLKFKIAGDLSPRNLCVWRSDAKEQFVRLSDIKPVNGEFTIVFDPKAIYSLSTTSGQQKGGFNDVPAVAQFPFPYRETFDSYTDPALTGYQPRYMADICGGFEIAERPDGTGKCLRQVIAKKAQNWAPEWMPYTIIGDPNWTHYSVSADILLERGGWAGVMGRINNTGNGWVSNPKGYYARLYDDGRAALYVINDSKEGSPGKELAAAQVAGFNATQWHNLRLQFVDAKLFLYVDDVEVLSTNDATFGAGLAGLVTGGEHDARYTALFDNLIIKPVGKGAVEEKISQRGIPMYQSAANSAGGSPPARDPSVVAGKYLDQFTSGSMLAKQSWDLALAAINSGNFDGALSTLQELQMQTDLSSVQKQAINETLAAVRSAIEAKRRH
jgi:galactosylceramidase